MTLPDRLRNNGPDWLERHADAGDFAGLFDHFHEEAASQVGYADFGAADYRDGLAELLASLDASERNPVEIRRICELIVQTLAGRLHAEQGWADRPDCLARPLVPPLIIAGIPRSGTTALHNLLSMDPGFQGLERWLGKAPMPRPPRDGWEANPAYGHALKEVRSRDIAAPEAQRAHRISAEAVDECLIPMAQSFVSNVFGSQMDVPDYDDWFLDQDETASYRRYADILRLVGADDARRWLLKNPSHILGIEGLLNAFPDAAIIQTHRHPGEAIASLNNLLAKIQQADEAGHARIARRSLKVWGAAVSRAMTVQDRAPGRIFDVDFREFLRAPMTVVEAIYEHFDMALGDEARAAMTAWIAANPRNKEGVHSYTLESGGLGAGEISDTFSAYIERYGLDVAH